MAAVFISYRRADTRWAALALSYHINIAFPKIDLFHDISSIRPGADFIDAIEEAVGKCQVLLALVGPHWLTATNAKGERRLESPEDFVRFDIAEALKRDIVVLPVLIGGAQMPAADDLPTPLKRFPRRNGLNVNLQSSHRDFDAICETLETHLGLTRHQPVNEPAPDASDLLHQRLLTPTMVARQTGEAVAQALIQAGTDAKTMITVAQIKEQSGEYQISEAVHRAAHPMLAKLEDEADNWLLYNRGCIAGSLMDQGRSDEAEIEYRKIIADYPDPESDEVYQLLSARQNLAAIANNRGGPAEAEPIFTAMIPEMIDAWGERHPETLNVRHSLALTKMCQGRLRECEDDLRAVIDLWPELEQEDYDDRIESVNRSLALALIEQGVPAKARAFVPDNDGAPIVYTHFRHKLMLAMLADAEGDAALAETLLHDAENILATTDPSDGFFRMLAKYRTTRTPGKPGGTALWMTDKRQ